MPCDLLLAKIAILGMFLLGWPSCENIQRHGLPRSHMTKGSDARYLGDTLKLKVAQGVVGAVADKGSVLRFIPYTMQAVKQEFQDLGASSLQSAYDLLRSETRLEVYSCRITFLLFSVSFIFLYFE